MTKFFSINSHSDLDLESRTLKVELARAIIIPNSYDMKVATKEWSITEKISRLSWESNPVLTG